jgi:hypothetical protein
MKKKIFARKLTLQRETLRSLEGAQLKEAAGARTNESCCNSSCDTYTLVTCPTLRDTCDC